MSTDEFQVVFMTVPDREEAERIAEALVTERLAGCVNMLGDCRSVYRWQGKIEKDDEVLMLAKTRASKFAALEKRVTELHSYDVPEIIAVNLKSLSDGYLGFLKDVL
jgi:periplasmic divalent cation tolerance protein